MFCKLLIFNYKATK